MAGGSLSVPLHLLHSSPVTDSPLSSVQADRPVLGRSPSVYVCTPLPAHPFFFVVPGQHLGLLHARQALHQRLAVGDRVLRSPV